MSALLVVLSPMLFGGACEHRETIAEFEARAWNRSCSTDSDCVLVSAPCDHCESSGVAIHADEHQIYVDTLYRISCNDYDDSDQCGDALDRRAVCRQGVCGSVIAD